MNALERLALRGPRNRGHRALLGDRGPGREVTPAAYRVSGLSPFVKLGDAVDVRHRGRRRSAARWSGIDRSASTVKAFGGRLEAGLGAAVRKARPFSVAPDASWKGRVINALGEPVDGGGPLPHGPCAVPVDAEPPAALRRAGSRALLKTGVRAIDIFCPLCAGQRIGIFAGSGVGKSTCWPCWRAPRVRHGGGGAGRASAAARCASSSRNRSAPTGTAPSRWWRRATRAR